ncbi:MAG: thiamine pyrophosphate-dependent enzyme [Ignavibacteriae bacterium]|nr:thiamine pyrophosphate-dependent enzyme [Ignavibacteriota bacterium]
MNQIKSEISKNGNLTADYKNEVITDYKIAYESRQVSLLGRKETLMGRAQFGIFGDGKEVAQIALAKTFQDGDFRSGYYRDQTFAFYTGMSDKRHFFYQLYGETDVTKEHACGGRSMNNHFATRLLDENGKWKNQMKMKNTSSDIAPTAAQMHRLLGLAYASKLYRHNPELSYLKEFSVNGNEVAFGTIGNASTSEGVFYEAINAAGVLMVPLAMSIWDDGFGISVPNIYQMTKSNISEILGGFSYDDEKEQGFKIYRVNGWDYENLVKTYKEGIALVREKHIPAIFHITEVTQPQGHSTSGSHERYKTKERLQWEKDFDCLVRMRKWMIDKGISTDVELNKIEEVIKADAKKTQQEVWTDYCAPIKKERNEVVKLISAVAVKSKAKDTIESLNLTLTRSTEMERKVSASTAFDVLVATKNESTTEREKLNIWYNDYLKENEKRFNTFLHSQSDESPLLVKEVKPVYSDKSPMVAGREVLLAFFDEVFKRDPRVFAIGEDVGQLGDVNQGMAGLQSKYGDIRVTDTGIREQTIVGQGIGAALRGLRPIVEVQYLDYLFYAIQILTDDLANLHYRTAGGQKAPLIIRTRGHRLVGIFHSGSPMGTIISCLRGIHICVPRNMTQAAGFYNTLLKSDDPGMVIERLNAYRFKEKLPDNIADICLPLGLPEVLEEGNDITVVTYGATVDIVKGASAKLKELGISIEVVDVQTLLPFDRFGIILKSIQKTNRVLFVDEDVPGGATAFMMQQIVDEQGGYQYLDSKPQCLSAKAHRPPYGVDGDYFTKPSVEDVIKTVYEIMNEANPKAFPKFY